MYPGTRSILLCAALLQVGHAVLASMHVAGAFMATSTDVTSQAYAAADMHGMFVLCLDREAARLAELNKPKPTAIKVG